MEVHRALLGPQQPVVGQAKQILPLCVGLRDAARLLGISDTHLEKHVSAGEIPVVRIGARRLFRVASLDKWLQEHEQAANKSEN